MILTELFGFHSKNTITSDQFHQILKLHVIGYLEYCIKLLSHYNYDNAWGDECEGPAVELYMKKCFSELKKNGLYTVRYDSFADDMYYVFLDNWKDSVLSWQESKSWSKNSATYKKGLLDSIKEISKPKFWLVEKTFLRKTYNLPS